MATFDNVTDTLAGSQVLNAAILIGGRARRLEGRFKPLLPVGGRTMLARQLEALAAAGVENIVLVGRWSAEVRPPVPVFADAMEDGGSLGALYTALLVTPEDRTIVLAADMPFVAAALTAALARVPLAGDVAVPRTTAGLHPLCAVYRRSVASHLKRRIDRGALRVREALEELRVAKLEHAELARLDVDDTMLMNVNTPADYERACELARYRT
jgi:molybdenum cofactor guanylyltransferase